MSSILERLIAEQFAESIDENGQTQHICASHFPTGLGKYEDSDYQRFDPTGYQKLKNLGVETLELEIADLELVGSVLDASDGFGYDISGHSSQIYYKHAIAIRLNKLLLIADNGPETAQNIEISQLFGNSYQVL